MSIYSKISVDLGCGSTPRNPFNANLVYGIDINDIPELNIIKKDLVFDNLPFPDNYVDYISAFDFIEHIPRIIYTPERRQPFIELMNEIWRTLKPGGLFYSFTPAFPHPQAFYDPTHVNYITEETFALYFDNVNILARKYGFIGKFKIIEQKFQQAHLHTILEKESLIQ